MKTMKYTKIKEIDGVIIYKDKKGYFIFEHYSTFDKYYALRQYLGKTIQAVEQTLTDILDWHYRYWHGEAEKIIKFKEELSLCII